MAGIFNGGECPPNSEIVLDEHGEATGELKEHASMHISNILSKSRIGLTKLRLLKKGVKIACPNGYDQRPQHGRG